MYRWDSVWRIDGLKQTDMNKLLAYSSLSHIGLIAASIFILNLQAIEGALFQIFVHGLCVTGLFALVGTLESTTGSSSIDASSGFARKIQDSQLTFYYYFSKYWIAINRWICWRILYALWLERRKYFLCIIRWIVCNPWRGLHVSILSKLHVWKCQRS